MDDPEDIIDAYHRVMEAHAVPFDPDFQYGEWHLTLFYLPSLCPETIYDIDCREEETLIHRARFSKPVWTAVFRAAEHKGQMEPFDIERACERLSSDSLIHEVVREERIFRVGAGDLQGTDGEGYVLVFTYPGGNFRFETWAPYETGQKNWTTVIDSVLEAARVLPPSTFEL